MLDKFKGALIGLAVGDALGATTEFMTKEEVREKHGYLNEIIGGGWLHLKAGEVTDDTEMTLCVAKGILQNYNDPIEKIGEEFLKWIETDPKDVGVTTSLSIRSYNGDWFKAAKEAHQLAGMSAGNGSLMRCLPIALAYNNLMKISKLSEQQSKMTHYDELASIACIIYNRIAYKIINGETLKSAIVSETIYSGYRDIFNKKLDILPTGYVVNTFSWVLNILYNTNSFSEVVEILTNLGEDSDTTASIAGGLAGLYYGYDAIDNKYKDKIIIKKELEDIAEQLYNVREKTEMV